MKIENLANKHLTIFEKPKALADTKEKVGGALLYPTSLAWGHRVKVVDNHYQELSVSKVHRVFMGMVCLLLFPLILPMTLIGMAIRATSQTHQASLKAYFSREENPKPLVSERADKTPPATSSIAPPERKEVLLPDILSMEDVEQFMRETKDSAKITAAVLQAEEPNRCFIIEPSVTDFCKAASSSQLPAVLAGCQTAERRAGLLNELLDNYHFYENETSKKSDRQRLIEVVQIFTNEQLLECAELWKTKSPSVSTLLEFLLLDEIVFSDPLIKTIEGLIRDNLDTIDSITLRMGIDHFSDKQLQLLCHLCGDHPKVIELVSSDAVSNARFIRLSTAIFSLPKTSENLLGGVLFRLGTSKIGPFPFTNEQVDEIKKSFVSFFQRVDFSVFPAHLTSPLLRATQVFQVPVTEIQANTFTEKAVEECLRAGPSPFDVGLGIPHMERLFAAIDRSSDDKKAPLLQRGFDSLAPGDFEQFLTRYPLSKEKALMVIKGSQQLTDKASGRLRTVLDKVEADSKNVLYPNDLQKFDDLISFLFKESTVDQSVAMLQILIQNNSGFVSKALIALGKEPKKVEAVVTRSNTQELNKIISKFMYFSISVPGVKEVFISEMRSQNKYGAVLAKIGDIDLISILEVASKEEIKLLISQHAKSPLPDTLQKPPLYYLFSAIGKQAWKKNMDASDKKIVIDYLRDFENNCDTTQFAIAFFGLVRAFGESADSQHYPPIHWREKVKLAKTSLFEILTQLKPDSQLKILSELPCNRENVILCLKKPSFFPPCVLDLIIGVSFAPGEKWTREEIQLLTRKVDSETFAQVFVYMPAALKKMCLDDIQTSPNRDERMSALRTVLTEEERKRESIPSGTVEEVS